MGGPCECLKARPLRQKAHGKSRRKSAGRGRKSPRGLAFGLGSVIGATILVYLVVASLSKIDFIPIIGEWAKEIADVIRQNGANP